MTRPPPQAPTGPANRGTSESSARSQDHAVRETTPRLYVPDDLSRGVELPLGHDQAHYLKNVLRLSAGDPVRIFNGRDGEWAASVQAATKKHVTLAVLEQSRPQPGASAGNASAGNASTGNECETHLVFAPIKKTRMDFLLEKAVELGVTHLHPCLMDHGQVRKIRTERLEKQIIEAVEQSERLTLPELSPLKGLEQTLDSLPTGTDILFCVARREAAKLSAASLKGNTALVIGPEGGFSSSEEKVAAKYMTISLGTGVLRAETAAICALSWLRLQNPEMER